MMRMICEYHEHNSDQTESMQCSDCNKCVDCGEVYYDDENDPGNDECPHCIRKEKERQVIDYGKEQLVRFFERLSKGEDKAKAQCEMYQNVDDKYKEVFKDDN
jgi:hypothetical protein